MTKKEELSLQAFRDRHKGKKALICGSGFSLNQLQQSDLQRFVTFGINAAVMKYDFNYMVLTDCTVLKSNYIQMLNPEVTEVLLTNYSCDYNLLTHPRQSIILRRRTHQLKVTKDDRDTILTDAIQTAVQIAYVMGCSPIVLIGADCRYKGGVKYFYEETGQKVEYAHTQLRRYKMNDLGTDLALNLTLEHWGKFTATNPHVKLLNASEGKIPRIKNVKLAEV